MVNSGSFDAAGSEGESAKAEFTQLEDGDAVLRSAASPRHLAEFAAVVPDAAEANNGAAAPAPAPERDDGLSHQDSMTTQLNAKCEPAKPSLQCSVPLDKVKNVLELCRHSQPPDKSKLSNLYILENYLKQKQTNELSSTSSVVSPIETDPPLTDPATEPLPSTSRPALKRMYCLFCERTFTSNSLRQKHVDRCHSAGQTRRSSSRTSSHSPSVTACCFCSKLNNIPHTLKQLLEHLVLDHSNRYFGCVTCQERFTSIQSLRDHNKSVHDIEDVDNKPLLSRISDSSNQDQEIPVQTDSNRTSSTHIIKSDSDLISVSSSKIKRTSILSEKGKSDEKELEKSGSGFDVDFEDSIRANIITPDETKPQKNTDEETTILRKLTRSSVAREKKNNVAAKKISVKSTKNGVRSLRTTRASVKQHNNINKTRKNIKNETTNSDKIVELKKPKITSTSVFSLVNAYTYKYEKIYDHASDSIKDANSVQFNAVFDKEFYCRTVCNIRDNLMHHLDGKLNRNIESEGRISNFEHNPANVPETYVKSTSDYGNFGCDLSLNAVTPVATLLASSQYGEDFDAQIEYGAKASQKKAKKVAVVKYKFPNKKYNSLFRDRTTHTDLTCLDIWTQFTVKERQHKCHDDDNFDSDSIYFERPTSSEAKHQVDELNTILDTRGPFEDLRVEADAAQFVELRKKNFDQISEEASKDVYFILEDLLNRVIVTCNIEQQIKSETIVQSNPNVELNEENLVLPNYLGLQCADNKNKFEIDKTDKIALICSSQDPNVQTPTRLELTGEWTRPRLYICAACGFKLPNLKLMEEHKNSNHPHIWCSHYEFVGSLSQTYRHLSIPGLGKVGLVEMLPQNRLWQKSDARVCTKCTKQCHNLGELHKHILECGGDWTWMLARKKCKYRPYGARTRRRRQRGYKRSCNPEVSRVKPKIKSAFIGPRPKPSKPSDAETIKRMLENLPAKRNRKMISMRDGIQRPRKQLMSPHPSNPPKNISNKSSNKNFHYKNAPQITKNTLRSALNRKVVINNMRKQKNENEITSKLRSRVNKENTVENTEKVNETINDDDLSTQLMGNKSKIRNKRMISRILGSKIFDTNSALITRRRIVKAITQNNLIRRTRLRTKMFDSAHIDSFHEKDKLDEIVDKNSEKSNQVKTAEDNKRSSPRNQNNEDISKDIKSDGLDKPPNEVEKTTKKSNSKRLLSLFGKANKKSKTAIPTTELTKISKEKTDTVYAIIDDVIGRTVREEPPIEKDKVVENICDSKNNKTTSKELTSKNPSDTETNPANKKPELFSKAIRKNANKIVQNVKSFRNALKKNKSEGKEGIGSKLIRSLSMKKSKSKQKANANDATIEKTEIGAKTIEKEYKTTTEDQTNEINTVMEVAANKEDVAPVTTSEETPIEDVAAVTTSEETPIEDVAAVTTSEETSFKDVAVTTSEETPIKDVAAVTTSEETPIKDVAAVTTSEETPIKDVAAVTTSEETSIKDVAAVTTSEETPFKDVAAVTTSEETPIKDVAAVTTSEETPIQEDVSAVPEETSIKEDVVGVTLSEEAPVIKEDLDPIKQNTIASDDKLSDNTTESNVTENSDDVKTQSENSLSTLNKLKCKMKRSGRGLNDCIAMLRCKLEQKTNEPSLVDKSNLFILNSTETNKPIEPVVEKPPVDVEKHSEVLDEVKTSLDKESIVTENKLEKPLVNFENTLLKNVLEVPIINNRKEESTKVICNTEVAMVEIETQTADEDLASAVVNDYIPTAIQSSFDLSYVLNATLKNCLMECVKNKCETFKIENQNYSVKPRGTVKDRKIGSIRKRRNNKPKPVDKPVEMHIPNVPVLLNTAFISNQFNSDHNSKSFEEVSDDDVPLSTFISNESSNEKIKVKLPAKKKKRNSKKPIAFTPLILNNQDSFVPLINLHEQTEQKVAGENSLNREIVTIEQKIEEIKESNNIPNEDIQTSGTTTQIEENSSIQNITDNLVSNVPVINDINLLKSENPSKDSNTLECESTSTELLNKQESTAVPEKEITEIPLSQIIMAMEDEPLDNDLINKTLVETVTKQTFQDTVPESTECDNKIDYLDSGKENSEEKTPNVQIKRQRRAVKKNKIKRKLASGSLNEGCNNENIQINVTPTNEEPVTKVEPVKKRITRTKNRIIAPKELDSSSKTTTEGKKVNRTSRSLTKTDVITSQPEIIDGTTLEEQNRVLQNDILDGEPPNIEIPFDSTSDAIIDNKSIDSGSASVEITPPLDSKETPPLDSIETSSGSKETSLDSNDTSSLATREIGNNADEKLSIEEKDDNTNILMEDTENVTVEKQEDDSSFVQPNEVPVQTVTTKKTKRKSRSRTKIIKPDDEKLIEKIDDIVDTIENIVQNSDASHNSKHKRKSKTKSKLELEDKTLEELLEQKNLSSINQDNVIESVIRNEEASIVADQIQQRRITRSKNRVKDTSCESILNVEKGINTISESTCALSLANIIPVDIPIEDDPPCKELNIHDSSQIDNEKIDISVVETGMNEVADTNLLDDFSLNKEVQPTDEIVETSTEEPIEILKEDVVQKSTKKRKSRGNRKLANAITDDDEDKEQFAETVTENKLSETSDELIKSIDLEINEEADSVALDNTKNESNKKSRKKKSSRYKSNASSIETTDDNNMCNELKSDIILNKEIVNLDNNESTNKIIESKEHDDTESILEKPLVNNVNEKNNQKSFKIKENNSYTSEEKDCILKNSENNIYCNEIEAVEEKQGDDNKNNDEHQVITPDIQIAKKKKSRKFRSTGLINTINDTVTYDEPKPTESIDTLQDNNVGMEKKKRRSRSNKNEKNHIGNNSSECIENTNEIQKELTIIDFNNDKLEEPDEVKEPFKMPENELNISEKRKNKKSRGTKQPIKLKIIPPVENVESEIEKEFKRCARLRNTINYAEVETDVSLDAPITEEPFVSFESQELYKETLEDHPRTKSKITLKISLDSTIKTIEDPIVEATHEETNERKKRRKSKNYFVNTSILDTVTEPAALKSPDCEKKRKRRSTKSKEVVKDAIVDELDVDEDKPLLDIVSELKAIETKDSGLLLDAIEIESKTEDEIIKTDDIKLNFQMIIENEPDTGLMESKDIPEIMPDLNTLVEEVLPPQLSDSEDEIPLAALAKGKKLQDECADLNSVPSDLKELDVSTLGFKNDAIDVSEISVNSILKDIVESEKDLNEENSRLTLQCSSFDFEDDNVINQEELSQFVNITNQTLLENIEKEDELYNLNEKNITYLNSSDINAEMPVIDEINKKPEQISLVTTPTIEKIPDKTENIFNFLKTPTETKTCDSDFITTPDLADTSLVMKIKNTLKVKIKKPKKTRRRIPKSINKIAVKRKDEEEFCEICNKVFKHKQSLVNHKITLTHIAKLSEIEARENVTNKAVNDKCVKEVENIVNICSEIINEDANDVDKTEIDECPQLPENSEANEINDGDIAEPVQELLGIESQNTVTNFMPGLINSANNTLKLIDIINEVLDKPVNDKNYSPRSIRKSPMSCDSTETYMEPKRYKSLGERKSFDSDNYNLPCKNSDDSLKPISNGEILCKQLSILENIIEETNPTLKNYIDDSLSLSSNPFEEPPIFQKKNFHNFENISETFTKPAKQRNDGASKESIHKKKCSKENTTRKILNRDEELFVECCSLLKSGSEISGAAKKSTKQIPLNNFSRSNDATWIIQKQQNSDRFIQRDSYSWLAQTSRVETPIGEPFSNNDWSNSNSAVSSEWLAQKAPSPDRPIESGTVNKKSNNNSGEMKYSDIQFEDISIASSLDTSKTLMAADNSNTDNIRLDFHHIDFSNTNFNNEPERRDFISDETQFDSNSVREIDDDSENVNDKEEKSDYSIPLAKNEEEDVSSKEEYDPEFKQKMVTAFGGLMAKALGKRLQAVVKKTKKSRGKRDYANALQAPITDYAVPVKKSKLNQTDSDSNDCPKKMRTKGAMKIFEGLKVSIPTQDLNLKEVLNCSTKGKKEQEENNKDNNEGANLEMELIEPKVKNGTVKNILKRFGNKLGLREKKKKNYKRRSPKSKNRSNKTSTHDVYDFEESVDNNAVSNSRAFSVFKPEAHQTEGKNIQESQKSSDDKNELGNWIAETDDSDTDRYYDSMSFEEMSVSSESLNENNLEIKPKITQKKNPEKSKDNQKKFMIMGRIFKNASKPKLEDKIPEIRDISSEENSKLVENYLECVESVVKDTASTEIPTVPNPATNKLSKKEMDLLFDKLLEEEKKLENLEIQSRSEKVEKEIIDNDVVFNKPLTIEKHIFDKRKSKDKLKIVKTKKRQRHNSDSNSSDEFRLGGKQSKSNKKHYKTHRKSTKSKKETGINMEQEIKECIGVAGRKSQRKCTSGKQNILAEFWSSDESSFEEIIKSQIINKTPKPIHTEITSADERIQERSNSSSPTLEESTAKKEEKKNNLDIYDFESDMESQIEEYHTKSKSEQCKEGEKDEITCEMKLKLPKKISKPKRCRKQVTEYDIECNRRRTESKHRKMVENDEVLCEQSLIDSLAVSRKKRNAGEQLYYWSSSSDDEFQDLIEVKPIREDTEDDRPMQHGWIVGDSPKKLVTMLAQAKGKKIDGETVKEQNNKKNRVTL